MLNLSPYPRGEKIALYDTPAPYSSINRACSDTPRAQLVDPVVAAAACVTALQTLASREADPATEGVVVSVTRLSTPRESTALNVMPDEVELGGTIRAFTVAAFERMQRRVYEVIRAQAQLHHCNATVDADGRIPYPPVVNEARLVDVGLRLAAQLNDAADAVQTQAAPIMVRQFINQQPTELASWPADEQSYVLTQPHSIDSACAPIPYASPAPSLAHALSGKTSGRCNCSVWKQQ
jgi:hypothetical protein